MFLQSHEGSEEIRRQRFWLVDRSLLSEQGRASPDSIQGVEEGPTHPPEGAIGEAQGKDPVSTLSPKPGKSPSQSLWHNSKLENKVSLWEELCSEQENVPEVSKMGSNIF